MAWAWVRESDLVLSRVRLGSKRRDLVVASCTGYQCSLMLVVVALH